MQFHEPAVGSDLHSHKPFSYVIVSHRNRSIAFDLKIYAAQKTGTVDAVFDYINRYLQTLPEDVQDNIFECYSEAKRCLDDVIDQTHMHLRLTRIVTRLYKLIDLEDITQWCRKHARIRIPPTIKDTYDELDISGRGNRDVYEQTTYLRSDYEALIYTAVAMRAMIPIWSEYCAIDRDMDEGKGKFAEYRTLGLMKNTAIMKSPAVIRLRDYIARSEIKDNNPMGGNRMASLRMAAALGGLLGSSELPDWMLANVIIRKLAVCELSSTGDDSSNVISVIFHYVSNTLKGLERKFDTRVRNKVKPTESDDDDNKSLLETYKVKQEISDGDLMVLSIYTEDPIRVAQRLIPEIDANLVQVFYDHLIKRTDYQPEVAQIALLRYLMSPLIPPRSIDNINKMSIISCLSAAQAMLWQSNRPMLALLLTSMPTVNRMGLLMGGQDLSGKIPKEIQDELNVIYRHHPQRNSKERDRRSNVAYRAIDAIAMEISKCHWTASVPNGLSSFGYTEQMDLVDNQGHLNIPLDFRSHLADLVIYLAKSFQTRKESSL